MIVPSEGVSGVFLMKLNTFIRKALTKNPNLQFFLVVGGGTTARDYRDAGREVVGHELTLEDLDWLGVHATRLNAHLIRTIFQDLANPYIIEQYEIIRKVEEPVVVAAGWKPGWSTDYCATLICEDYKVKTILNLSNVPQVYDKDPNKFKDAKPKSKMSWTNFRKLVGNRWIPGMHAPFDPVAATRAQELGLEVVCLSGDDFTNIEKYFAGKKFLGTVIS